MWCSLQRWDAEGKHKCELLVLPLGQGGDGSLAQGRKHHRGCGAEGLASGQDREEGWAGLVGASAEWGAGGAPQAGEGRTWVTWDCPALLSFDPTVSSCCWL